MKTLIKSQAGDTIIEVLISLTVLATVIGLAYAISSQALIKTQQAHERVRATKLAEGQIERLKYLAENNPTVLAALTGAAVPKCISESNTIVVTCLDDSIFTKKFLKYTAATKQFEFEISWLAFRSGAPQNVTIMYRIPVL